MNSIKNVRMMFVLGFALGGFNMLAVMPGEVNSSKNLPEDVQTAGFPFLRAKKATSEELAQKKANLYTQTPIILRKSVVSTITLLRRHLFYWHAQQDHSMSYWLERSPRHWISGPFAAQEVRKNAQLVSASIDSYYKVLNAIDNWQKSGSEADSQFIAIARTVPFLKDEELQGDLEKQCTSILEAAKQYQKRAVNELASAKMPGHFERNWLRYAAGLGAACMIYANRDAIATRTTVLASKLYENNIKPMQKQVERALGWEKEKEEVLRQSSIALTKSRSMPELVDQLKIVSNQLNETLSSPGSKIKLNTYNPQLQALASWARENTGYSGEVDFDNPATVENLLLHLTNKFGDASYIPNMGFWGSSKGVGKSDIAGKLPEVISLCGLAEKDAINKIGSKVVVKVGEMQEILTDIVAKLAKDSDRTLADSKQIIAQQDLTLAMATTIPVVAAAYAGYKGLKRFGWWMLPKSLKLWVYPHDSTRRIVQEVHRALTDPSTDDAMKNGKKIYFIERLEHYGKMYVPTAHRRAFLADIAQLKAVTNPEIQKQIIDRMWKSYPFLSPDYQA